MSEECKDYIKKSVEEIEKEEENKKTKLNDKKKIILYSLLAIVIMVLICFAYTYLSKYTYYKDTFEIKEYITSDMYRAEGGNEYSITFDELKLNALLHEYYNDDSNETSLKDWWIKVDNQRIYMNFEINGVPVPISAKVNLQYDNESINISYDKIRWGKLNIPVPLKNKINDYMYNQEKNTIKLANLEVPEYINVKEVFFYDKAQVIFQVDNEGINKELNKYINDYNEELVEVYGESTDKYEIIAHEIITNKQFSEVNLEMLIQDFITDKNLVQTLLIVLSDEEIEKIFEKYGSYFRPITIDQIYYDKSKHIAEQRVDSSKLLLDSLNKYEESLGTDLLHLGYRNPYDKNTGEIISLDKIIQKYELEFTDEYIKNTNFVYHIGLEEFQVAYHISDKQVMIYYNDTFEILNINQYEQIYPDIQYQEGKLLSKSNKERTEIEQAIAEFVDVDNILARYLISDGNSAFAIISSGTNYNTFTSFALEYTDNEWAVIDVDIVLENINVNYPDYNISLVPTVIPDSKEYIAMSNNDINNVIEDLYSRKIISSKDSKHINYIQPYKDYIVLMIDNGNQYVYKVENGILDSIYTKSEALSKFNDIPEVLFIQD